MLPPQRSALAAGAAAGKHSLLGSEEPTIWYEAAAALPQLTLPPPATAAKAKGPAAAAAAAAAPPPELVESCRAKAEQLLEAEVAAFESTLARRNAADAAWLQQVRRAGTTRDKVAAATLLIQVRETNRRRRLFC